MADESSENIDQDPQDAHDPHEHELPERSDDAGAQKLPDAASEAIPDAVPVSRDVEAGVSADMHAAEGAIDSVAKAAEAVRDAAAEPVHVPDFEPPAGGGRDTASMSLLDDVALHVKIELGRTRMFVEDVLRLNADSVIELDKAAGDPVDIYVNNRHVARGEVLVLNENFCVRVNEILDSGQTPEETPTGSSD